VAKHRKQVEGLIEVTATATCTTYRGVEEATGRLLNAAAVAQQVGWLSAIVQDMTCRMVAEHWSPTSLDTLATGVGPDGRELPSQGYVALQRLGWTSSPPADVHVSSRVRRIAEEHAARLLRAGVHRDRLVRGITSALPENLRKPTPPEWDALRAALPDGTTTAIIRNRIRQAGAFLAEHGRRPRTVCEAEPPPRVSGQILLAAADKQHTVTTRNPDDPGRLAVRVLLPTTARPGRGDWQWVVLDARLPRTVGPDTQIGSPTLRLVGGRVRVDLPFRRRAPLTRANGHVRAIGVDWGVNTLLTAAAGRVGADRRGRDRVVTTGKPHGFDASGVSAKIGRLRTLGEHLRTRLDRYDRLLDGRPDTVVQTKRDRLGVEHNRVTARLRNLNTALAWAAARWTVDLAQTHRASVIYIEDLATLEAGGMGRMMNRRLGPHIRGIVFHALRHLAGVQGIAVVTVPARGTSAGCPRCGRYTSTAAKTVKGRRTGFKHVTSPDRPTSTGHKWSVCVCGLSTDRDHAAAERILGRGLLGQTTTFRNRTTGQMAITTVTDGPVRRSPKTRRSPAAVPSINDRLMPLRREVPATDAPITAKVQCPAGRQPQDHRTMVAQTPSRNARKRRRPRGVRPPGRGFHLHVTATATGKPPPRPSVTQRSRDAN
jgi:hypothetical protein